MKLRQLKRQAYLRMRAEDPVAKARRERLRQLVVPTEEEDTIITAAAMSDTDSIPFTDAEWKRAKVRRGALPSK